MSARQRYATAAAFLFTCAHVRPREARPAVQGAQVRRCGLCDCQIQLQLGRALCDACEPPHLGPDIAARFAVIDSWATRLAARDVKRYWSTGMEPAVWAMGPSNWKAASWAAVLLSRRCSRRSLDPGVKGVV